MRALTTRPGQAGSLAIAEVGEPASDEGTALVEGLAIGLCATDSEIVAGEYGEAPPGSDLLILGHESLGRVLECPPGAGVEPGDLVVVIVRRSDPVPCTSCAAGEWDMCRNGRYTEHGIKGLHGVARDRWRVDPERLVRIDPKIGQLGVLLEPATILAKAWEHTERIGRRAYWQPAVAAVTGAGPVGLLAALMGVQRGLEVHVYDRATEGPKPDAVRTLGAHYHTDSLPDSGVQADVLIECTGAPKLILDALEFTPSNSVICLTGVSPVGEELQLDVGALSRSAVLRNHAVFGTVNANRRHYEEAARSLAITDPAWLQRLITRRVPLDRYQEAFTRQPNDVKVVLEIKPVD